MRVTPIFAFDPPVIVKVGLLVYPAPGFVTATLVTAPPVTVTATVAFVPPVAIPPLNVRATTVVTVYVRPVSVPAVVTIASPD